MEIIGHFLLSNSKDLKHSTQKDTFATRNIRFKEYHKIALNVIY